MRRTFVAGNWKMNLNLAEARDLVAGISAGLRAPAGAPQPVDVAVCPPAVYLHPLREQLGDGPVQLGAQDVYFTADGAYTGEISTRMLTDVGARFVIIGHSERRHTIGHLEDDRMICCKVHAALDAALVPILCVGETLAERDAERTMEVLTYQITADLIGVKIARPEDLVIAYEPVWAIGTGRNATPEQAQEAHAHLRAELRLLLGDIADGVRILYGGSVKPDNAEPLFGMPDVDGGLIGGASLKADSFLGIIRAAL